MAHKSHIVVETVSSANAVSPTPLFPLFALPPSPSCCVYVSESYAEQPTQDNVCLFVYLSLPKASPAMFVCQFYVSPSLSACRPPPPPSVCCLSCVTAVCMRLHLICINALAAASPNFCPHCTKEGGKEKLRKAEGGRRREERGRDAGSESSEKCANLVTKLARYFNIFRFAAAFITHLLSLSRTLLSDFALFVCGTLFKELVQITASWKL